MSENSPPEAATALLAQIALTIAILLIAFCLYLLLEVNTLKKNFKDQIEVSEVKKIKTNRIEIIDSQGNLSTIIGTGTQKQGFISIQGKENEVVRLSSTPEGYGIIGTFHDGKLLSFMSGTLEEGGLMGTLKEDKPLVTLTSQNEEGRIQTWAQDGQTYVDIAPRHEKFPVDTLIGSVPLINSPEESYALYLPPNYESSNAYPVLFLFNTNGNGKEIAQLAVRTARELSWILVASNSYRGGLHDPLSIVKNLERDVHMRFSAERGRYYSLGFSWGGWLAAWMANAYHQYFAGVIPIGSPSFQKPQASLPSMSDLLKETSNLSTYFLSGVEDNFLDENFFLQFDLQFGQKRFSQLETYPGSHHLPPERFIGKALRSFELAWLSSKRNLSDKKQAFVEVEIHRLVNQFYSTSNQWDQFVQFTPILPWVHRRNLFTGNTQKLLTEADEFFRKLRSGEALKNDIEAHKILAANTVESPENIEELDGALNAYQSILSSFPKTEGAKKSLKFKKVVEKLKKEISKNEN